MATHKVELYTCPTGGWLMGNRFASPKDCAKLIEAAAEDSLPSLQALYIHNRAIGPEAESFCHEDMAVSDEDETIPDLSLGRSLGLGPAARAPPPQPRVGAAAAAAAVGAAMPLSPPSAAGGDDALTVAFLGGTVVALPASGISPPSVEQPEHTTLAAPAPCASSTAGPLV